MPEQTERGRLIDELHNFGWDEFSHIKANADMLADFILKDRRRILSEVEKPLKEFKKEHREFAVKRNFQDCGCDACLKVEKALAKIAELKG